MNPLDTSPAGRDPDLWRLARRRASFKAHLFTFVLINAGLWLLWALTDRTAHPVPWPLWVTGFWGIGVVAQALEAYGSGGRSLTEREYERLTRQR